VKRVSQARGSDEIAVDWYKPGPSIQQFHSSTAKVRVLVGGRGSGKTTGVAVEAVRHCNHYAGAKVLCVRQTQVSNEDTSVKTFNEVYYSMGYRVDLDEEISLFRKWDGGLTVRIPSVAAVEAYNAFIQEAPRTRQAIKSWIDNEGDRLCSYIEFRGLKDENKSQGQLRGYECSMMIMIEADLLQEEDVGLGRACLRWKDAYGQYISDYSLILETNPPGKRHWIARMEAKHGSNDMYQFWHLRTVENKGNLRPGYIEELEDEYRDRPAHYRRYLLGEYADLYDGQPVFFAFKEDRHASENIPWPKGAYLVRGWDFGSTHANTFSAYFKIDFDLGKKGIVPFEYWWDLHEYYQEMSDTERQCRAVIDITEREFPFFNDRDVCAGVLDYCDPAGAQKKDTGASVEVLRKNGINPRWQTRVRSLDTTIAICNRLFETKDPLGRWVYRIDSKHCPRLYNASVGEYRYPFQGEAGFSSGEPIKGPRANGADHIADASRYPKINCLRLAQRIMDELKPATGLLGGRVKKLNPKRKYW